MKKFIEISIHPFAVGIIAAALILADSLISPLFVAGASFTWMAFINWTVFANANRAERLRASIGYVIGFLLANLMIVSGSWLSNNFELKSMVIPLAVMIPVFFVNVLLMYLNRLKKLFMGMIPPIFVGIALTFSGAGVNMKADSIKLLLLILIYGAIGILCNVGTDLLIKLFKKIFLQKHING